MMENIDKVIEQASTILNDKLKQLELLEAEKKSIIERYKNAKSAEKHLIEKEMKKSEEKYKNLCDEVLLLSDKVKKFKNFVAEN